MLKAYRRTIKIKGREIQVVTLKSRNSMLLAFKEELKKNKKILNRMGFKID